MAQKKSLFRLIIVPGFLLALAVACKGEPDADSSGHVSQAIQNSFLPSVAFAGDNNQSIADIAEKTVSSVVNISSEKVVTYNNQPISPFFNDPFFQQFFGHGFGGPTMPRERRESSLGSGVIVSEDGIILTNNHVVDKASKIQVTFSDGREFDAEVMGTDEKSDLGVVKLKKFSGKITTLSFGDSNRLRLGDVVLAIGNPFGVGQTVTMGIVSAKGRANVGIADYEDFIQTDAAINPGNSGGALVNMVGELVGINTAILSRSGGYQGIGFAIPSNMAKTIMDSLIKNGKVIRGYLGVSIQDIGADLAEALKLSSTEGALVSDVMGKSPADKAGLKRGDVIRKVDNETIGDSGQLRNIIATKGPKTTVTLEVARDGKKLIMKAVLDELPENREEPSSMTKSDGILEGLEVADLSKELRQRFRLSDQLKSGVLVTSIKTGSPASNTGLAEGDVILEINRQSIRNVQDFHDKAASLKKGRTLFLVQRGGSTIYLVLNDE